MTKDEALKLALEALENAKLILIGLQTIGIKAGATSQAMRLGEQFIQDRAITAIKEALAQPDPVIAEREACAVICDNRVLYTGYDCAAAIRSRDVYKFGWPIGDPRDILKSAKLKEKNT